MATAVVTNTVKTVRKADGGGLEVIGTLALTASPAVYVTGGLAIPWTDPTIKAQTNPVFVVIQGLNPGYTYLYDIVNAKIRIMIVATQLEIANNVAIDASISGDTITYLAKFGTLSLNIAN